MLQKILVADDERHIVEGLQMLLADDGYEVDTATDGKTAWEMVKNGGGYGVVLAARSSSATPGDKLASTRNLTPVR